MFKYWPVDIWPQPPFLGSRDGGILNREMRGWADYHFRCGGSSGGLGGAGGRRIAWSSGVSLHRSCLACSSGWSSIDWKSWVSFRRCFFGWWKSVLESIHAVSFGSWGLIAHFGSWSFDNVVHLLVFLSFWGKRYSFSFVRCILFQGRRYRLTFARLSILSMPAILGMIQGHLRLMSSFACLIVFTDLYWSLRFALCSFYSASFAFISQFTRGDEYTTRYLFSACWNSIGLGQVPSQWYLSSNNSYAIILELLLSIWSVIPNISLYSQLNMTIASFYPFLSSSYWFILLIIWQYDNTFLAICFLASGIQVHDARSHFHALLLHSSVRGYLPAREESKHSDS